MTWAANLDRTSLEGRLEWSVVLMAKVQHHTVVGEEMEGPLDSASVGRDQDVEECERWDWIGDHLHISVPLTEMRWVSVEAVDSVGRRHRRACLSTWQGLTVD